MEFGLNLHQFWPPIIRSWSVLTQIYKSAPVERRLQFCQVVRVSRGHHLRRRLVDLVVLSLVLLFTCRRGWCWTTGMVQEGGFEMVVSQLTETKGLDMERS
ncbi:hypothetical protein SLEP1_g18833 [Rubroshorea leprosula]|uniref:Uncharacterized protein n=1 Tax=Rubroshorea leprosula TaxID=152421 RepID=A0AAV5J7S8_9ROSI|nr:hypothetical protein SLEP1_g18833 [Rubroshorea leprosula]